MEILKTTDYERFELINGNRQIVAKKVKKIVADVKNGLNLFPYCPIVVSDKNGKFNIIDGQHRYEASMELDMPIYYVIAADIGIRDIARMNSATDKWKYRDFMDCYIRLGMEDYSKLKTFMRKYNVQLRVALGLLMGGKPRSASEDAAKFMDGKFRIKFQEEAERFLTLVNRLVGEYACYRDINLLKAIYQLMQINKWDVEVMEQKIKSNRHMFEKQSSPKTYMYLLEQIYNVKNHTRKAIL